ncbi:hypothetical protein B566_EDAN009693 [Ephemera danica]|nr:hypothetical protein B566_EDAN009693 [Ephemera danica]
MIEYNHMYILYISHTADSMDEQKCLELLIRDFSLNPTLGKGQAGWNVVLDVASAPSLHWHLTICSTLSKAEQMYLAKLEPGAVKPQRVLCGVVTNLATKKKERDINIEAYIKMREEDQGAVENASSLAVSIMCLEMLFFRHWLCHDVNLSPGCHKLRQGTSRAAAFVLYNYVRLVSILDKHSGLVTQGEYPELPPVDSVTTLLSTSKATLAQGEFPAPYTICNCLVDMNKPLSRYYRTHQILTEAREHLLPMMHVRLHVISAIARMMRHAFGLLGISPPQHM